MPLTLDTAADSEVSAVHGHAVKTESGPRHDYRGPDSVWTLRTVAVFCCHIDNLAQHMASRVVRLWPDATDRESRTEFSLAVSARLMPVIASPQGTDAVPIPAL